ncbi:unnamed protein product [Closterium sp. Yama58-4]|nr:unnamed protein product [Closterium sp. Yama58-4]
MAAAVGPMSCVLCKALLFDPARCDPCKHVYCRECIARFTDCPLCGCDVKALLPDEALAHAVDAFISAHVLHRPVPAPLPPVPAPHSESSHNAPEAAAAGGADSSGTDASAAADSAAAAAAEREAEAARVEVEALDLDKASPGSFLFLHAMRAMQHGNLPSARARFALSASSLKAFLSMPSAAAATATAAHADAARGGERAVQEGQQQGLERPGGGDSDRGAVEDELHHALCVTLNKLGDLHYRSDRVPEALALYQQALARRQHALARTEAGTHAGGLKGAVRETASKALDVAVSTAKVADAQQALGEEESAREGFSRALRLVQGVKGTLTAAAAGGQGDCLALLDKVEATQAFLQQQLAAATGTTGTAAAAGATEAGEADAKS